MPHEECAGGAKLLSVPVLRAHGFSNDSQKVKSKALKSEFSITVLVIDVLTRFFAEECMYRDTNAVHIYPFGRHATRYWVQMKNGCFWFGTPNSCGIYRIILTFLTVCASADFIASIALMVGNHDSTTAKQKRFDPFIFTCPLGLAVMYSACVHESELARTSIS